MKKCIACRKEIEDDATLCTNCSTHQNKWKNLLPYIGGIVTFVALIGSLISYTFSNALKIYNDFKWEDKIEIVNFEYTDRITILNVGDGPVYLSHIKIYSEITTTDKKRIITDSHRQPIDKVLNQHEFYTHINPNLHPKHINNIPDGIQVITEHVISGISDPQWDLLVNSFQNDECLSLNYYSENAPEYIHYKSFLDKGLRVVDATAVIDYISSKDGKRYSHKFPSKGIFILYGYPDCLQKWNRILGKSYN